ncbi:unnamed protein product, partial [Linum tenue]
SRPACGGRSSIAPGSGGSRSLRSSWSRSARVSELEGSEADIVQSFIVKHHTLIGILNQLVNRESSIVRLHHGVRHLGRREDGEGQHHSIRVLFPDLGDQQRPHPRSRPSSQRMAHLKPYTNFPPNNHGC